MLYNTNKIYKKQHNLTKYYYFCPFSCPFLAMDHTGQKLIKTKKVVGLVITRLGS